MFRAMGSVVFIAALMGLFASHALAANLLTNPGFEESVERDFVGWSSYVTRGAKTAVSLSTAAHRGRHAVLMDLAASIAASGDDVARLALTQAHKTTGKGGLLELGGTYRFSGYYRTEGDPKGQLMVQITGHRPFPTANLSPAADWTYAELEFHIPETAEQASIGVWANYGSRVIPSGRIWFDDLSLVKVGVAVEPVVIKDDSVPVTDTGVSAAHPGVLPVSTTAELLQALAIVGPGNTIVLADGVYTGHQAIALRGLRGTREQPIVIMAKNQGEAVIAGGLQFNIGDCSYVTMQGLKFTTSGEGGARRGAMIIDNCQNLRITRNHFALTETPGARTHNHWITLRGRESTDNRLDHNLFENKLQLGNFIALPVDDHADTMARGTRIDHNHFRDMAPLGVNGMEAIRVGNTRYRSMIDSRTIIEFNLFERVDGERSEIISIKNSYNVVRYNTFMETEGSVTFRYGDNNSVYANYFLGNGKERTGGVRIYGKGQRVYNNHFEGLMAAAVVFGSGNADDVMDLAETGYIRVEHVDVVYNTFVNNATNFSYQDRPTTYPLRPLDATVANNVFYAEDFFGHRQNLDYPTRLGLTGVTWSGNVASGPADPRPALSIDAIHFPINDARLVNAGLGTFSYVTADIEGKPRGERPDVGAFESAGLPLLRGPLRAGQVGPHASVEDLSYVPGAAAVYITAVDFAGTSASGSDLWWGPLEIRVDAVALSLGDSEIRLRAFVDDELVLDHRGVPAIFTVNRGELDEGPHELLLVATSSDGQASDERRLQFEVKNIVVLSPEDGAQVKGQVPLTLAVGLPDEVIAAVRVVAGDEVIFEGSKVPGEMRLDTRRFAEGDLDLKAEITRQDGAVSRGGVSLTVSNYWQLEDELLPPLDWGMFGHVSRSQTSEASSGWAHATGDEETFFGDGDRLVRTTAQTEFLTWPAPALLEAQVTLYVRGTRIDAEQVILSTSHDGANFAQVAYDQRRVGESGGWTQLLLTVNLIEPGTVEFFRLTLPPSQLPANDWQVGHVSLRGRNESHRGG